MTNTTPERKERVIKSLALLGLFGLIICIAWLSVQIITLLPSAVSSLASIADSVYNYDPRAARSIKLNESPENFTTGVPSTVRWDKPLATGTYSFSYRCGKDVFIEIKSAEAEFAGLECNKNYNLGNVDSVSVVIHKDKTSAVDLEYTISHFKTNSTEASVTKTVSAGIIQGDDVAIGPSTSVEVTVNDKPVTPKPNTSNQTNTTKPSIPTKPVTTYSYTYSLPVSDPKGKTDLSVGYLGIGQMVNDTFISTGLLKQDQKGALQFTVTNIGTKTSNDWTFSALLPNGTAYTSAKQAPLKPNEKATLTIIFSEVTDSKEAKFEFTVNSTGETSTKNNSLAWTTKVTK